MEPPNRPTPQVRPARHRAGHLDSRIGGAVGGRHPGQMPFRAGGVVAWGVGHVHTGPVPVESDLDPVVPGQNRGTGLLAVSGSGHNQYRSELAHP